MVVFQSLIGIELPAFWEGAVLVVGQPLEGDVTGGQSILCWSYAAPLPSTAPSARYPPPPPPRSAG